VEVLAVVRPGTDGLDETTPVGGVPMVLRAVRGLLSSGVVDAVSVLARHAAAVRPLLAGLPVTLHDEEAASVEDAVAAARALIHGRQRRDEPDGDACTVLVHDVARPLMPPALAAAVVAAARAGHAVAVPVLALTDTVKRVGPDGVVRDGPSRAGLRIVQTPQAVRTDLVGAAALAAPAGRTWVAAARPAHAVAGDPRALAVRGPWDLRTAELLLAGSS
jgi:2-C-methyl-D-erythritol 4-phosphate cytidylyltransferase